MVRYHLNPETGNPGICRADPSKPNSKGCRFKRSEDEHYATMEEAQAAYESSQSKRLFEEPTTKTVPAKGTAESHRDKSGWLKEEYARLAAPQGAFCPYCGKAADHRAAYAIVSNEWAYCSCGERYDSGTVKIEIGEDHPAYRFYTDKESVKDAVWYHASGDGKWDETVGEKDFEAHIGTEAAAFDRALTEYTTHFEWSRDSFYLYEVRVHPDAQIADEVAKDDNAKTVGKDEDADVTRYINIWEDLASISLAANSKKLQIVGRRTVSREEALERITPYNMAEPEDDEDLEHYEGTTE